MRKCRIMRWTNHMLGIVVMVSYKGTHLPTNFAPYALIRLAQEGYVRVGKTVTLTEAGREVVEKCEKELQARGADIDSRGTPWIHKGGAWHLTAETTT